MTQKSPQHSHVSGEVPPATAPKTPLQDPTLRPQDHRKPPRGVHGASRFCRARPHRDSSMSDCGPSHPSLNGAAPALWAPLSSTSNVATNQPTWLCCLLFPPLSQMHTNGETLGRTQSIDHRRAPCRAFEFQALNSLGQVRLLRYFASEAHGMSLELVKP